MHGFDSKNLLSDLTVYSKYARYLPQQKRRETWDECIIRNAEMHAKKYPQLSDEIWKVYSEFVLPKKVFPSMRSLQFAGPAIEKTPSRIYNCSYMPIDSIWAFSEAMFLLLGGTGLGISVQKHHVNQLPELIGPKKRTRRYLISDSIEGWADAIRVLMESYFNHKSTVLFDYSDIRQKGAYLVTAGGKAPGSKPLKDCIHLIKGILDTAILERDSGTKLTTLESHDLMCHIADAVLAGGIRRAAIISLFSIADNALLASKSGKWYETNPQRGRANNSVVIIRHKATREDFDLIWSHVKASGSGEPGMVMSNDKEYGINPCFGGNMRLKTDDGFCSFKDLANDNDGYHHLISPEGKVCQGKVWSNGVKNTIKIIDSFGNEFIVTPEHEFRVNGNSCQAKDLLHKSIDVDIHTLNFIDDMKITITSIEEYGEIEVFDFTIDTNDHWGVIASTNTDMGFIAHNCAEISLRNNSFCNLTTTNVSTIKSQKDLNDRVRASAFIGTLQAGYTDFHYLRDIWKDTTEEDSLLGVSMTGIGSGQVLKYNIKESAKIAVEENARVAEIIGIPKAKRVTAIKPEGSASLVAGASSGIHAWHAPYYIRRMRLNKNEAIYLYLKDKLSDTFLEDEFFNPETTAVLSIPVKAPNNSIFRDESEIDLLERVKRFQLDWISVGHRSGSNKNNVSVTVSVKDENWDIVGDWMWKNRNIYTGISVLPYDGHTYVQTPFEDITKYKYDIMLKELKDINIDLTEIKEHQDNTDLQGEVACSGGACSIEKI